MAFDIYMSDALEIISNTNGQTFDISYYKSDGFFGEKKSVRRCPGKTFDKKSKVNTGNTKTNISMAPKLLLVDANGKRFEIWKCLLISINGKLIDKRF